MNKSKLALETIEKKIIGSHTFHSEIVDSSSGNKSLMVNIGPSDSEIVIDTTDNYIRRQDTYELWFAEFLESNHTMLMENSLYGINLSMNVFTEDKSCSFTIFSNTLSRICKYDVRIRTNVVTYSKEEWEEWAHSLLK